MPPKRRTRGASNSNSLFEYNNQVELTFKGQPKENILQNVTAVGDSGSDEDDDYPILKKKKGKKGRKQASSSSDSSTSDSEPEQVKKITDNEEKDVCEISDEDDADVVPRPITPPPKILSNMPASGLGRQAVRLSRTIGEKMKYLEYLQKEDTPSPVATSNWSDVLIVSDNYGTPNSTNRKIKVRIRTRGGVERFQLNRNEKFQEIFNELAKKHDVNLDSLSFSFTDAQGNFQTLKAMDTPSSVNLSIADIIDCVVVQAQNDSFENSDNIVNIKVQGSDSKSVKQFKVLKNEPLGKMMQQYADFRQLPLSQLKFSFDGEAMTSEQSPDDLDMDEENVVDVTLNSGASR